MAHLLSPLPRLNDRAASRRILCECELGALRQINRPAGERLFHPGIAKMSFDRLIFDKNAQQGRAA
jgi:hypothetical protein